MSKWYSITPPKRKGDGGKPNKALVNRNVSFSSVLPASNENAEHHDQPLQSVLARTLSSSPPPVLKDVYVTGQVHSTGNNGGPGYKQSFSDAALG